MAVWLRAANMLSAYMSRVPAVVPSGNGCSSRSQTAVSWLAHTRTHSSYVVHAFNPRREPEESARQTVAVEDARPEQAQILAEPQPGPALVYLPAVKLALAGAAGFGLIAFDVFSPNSMHLLPAIDGSAHHFVTESVSQAFRFFWADKIISDAFIGLGLLGWFTCTISALISRRPTAIAVMAIAWACYVWGAGPVQFDPFLVDTLKRFFHRDRPSPMDPSFSFPSGHTSSATFLMGALIFVLLPAVLPPAEKAAGKAGLEPAKSRVQLPGWLYKAQGSWPLWGVSCLTTATGRVLADAHWVSDTMAAACLGAVCVATLAAATRPLLAEGAHVFGSTNDAGNGKPDDAAKQRSWD